MANPIDRELFDRLRAGGLRKSVARVISEATATGKGASGRAETAARNAIKELRSLADELEDRLRGGPAKQRSAAAQKAANTRKRQAASRSAAAKKGAATRAKRASSGTTSRASSSARSRARRRSGHGEAVHVVLRHAPALDDVEEVLLAREPHDWPAQSSGQSCTGSFACMSSR